MLAYSPPARAAHRAADPSTPFEPDDWRSQSSAFRGEPLRRNLAVVDRLAELAATKGMPVGRLAIAWVLAQPGVHVAIVGARSARHIEDSLAAADAELSAEDLAEIDRIVADGVSMAEADPAGVA